MVLHPEKDAATIRKRIEGLAHVGYLDIVDPSKDDPTWRSTSSGRAMAHAMREPTFTDAVKGWWLRHVFGLRIRL